MCASDSEASQQPPPSSLQVKAQQLASPPRFSYDPVSEANEEKEGEEGGGEGGGEGEGEREEEEEGEGEGGRGRGRGRGRGI